MPGREGRCDGVGRRGGGCISLEFRAHGYTDRPTNNGRRSGRDGGGSSGDDLEVLRGGRSAHARLADGGGRGFMGPLCVHVYFPFHRENGKRAVCVLKGSLVYIYICMYIRLAGWKGESPAAGKGPAGEENVVELDERPQRRRVDGGRSGVRGGFGNSPSVLFLSCFSDRNGVLRARTHIQTHTSTHANARVRGCG